MLPSPRAGATIPLAAAGIALAACHTLQAPKTSANERVRDAQRYGAAAAAIADQAATACPFPANVDKYEETSLSALTPQTPHANVAILRQVRAGCAVLTFTVGQFGEVRTPKVVSADSLAFATVAPRILAWSNFARGAGGEVQFMVRLAAQMQADGSVLIVFAFKDYTLNLSVPA